MAMNDGAYCATHGLKPTEDALRYCRRVREAGRWIRGRAMEAYIATGRDRQGQIAFNSRHLASFDWETFLLNRYRATLSDAWRPECGAAVRIRTRGGYSVDWRLSRAPRSWSGPVWLATTCHGSGRMETSERELLQIWAEGDLQPIDPAELAAQRAALSNVPHSACRSEAVGHADLPLFA